MQQILNSKNINNGTIIAGGNVQIGDNIYPPLPDTPKFLTRRPFKPEHVLGRKDDLKLLGEKLWSNDHIIILVNGEGGIGKTTLAAQYWLENEESYSHLGWLFAGESIQTALLSMAKSLGREFESHLNDNSRLEIFLQFLGNLSKPSLLIIDNANNINDLQKNYKLLKGLSNFHIILSSRINELANASIQRISGLDKNQAIDLFKLYYDKISDSDYELLNSIFSAIGFNTLVIELLAKNLREFNKFRTNYSIQELLENLQNSGLLQIKTTDIENTYGIKELQRAKPEEILRTMYDLTQLSQSQVKILSNISILPPQSINYDYLTLIIKPEEQNQFDIDINQLYLLGWIDYNDKDRTFKCSPVVQEIVKDINNKELFNLCRDSLRNLSVIFEANNTTELQNFENIAVNALNCFNQSEYEIPYLSDTLSTYFKDTGNYSQSERYSLKSLKIYEALKDINNIAKVLLHLGKLQQAQGRYREANSNYNRALGLIGNNKEHELTRVAIIKQRAVQLMVDGKLNESINLFETQLKSLIEINELNPDQINVIEHLAEIFQFLGDVYWRQGKRQQAFEYFNKMLRAFQALTDLAPNIERFKMGLALSYSRIGLIYPEEERYKVIDYFEKYYEIIKGLYENNINSEPLAENLASAQDYLGRIYMFQKRLNVARKFLEESNTLKDQIFRKNPQSLFAKTGLSISYVRLGNLEMEIGDLNRALSYYEIYNQMNIDLSSENPNSADLKLGLAKSYSKLGEIFERGNKFDQAIINYNLFNLHILELERSGEGAESVLDDLAISHFKLGRVFEKTSNKEKAILNYIEAETWSCLLCERTGFNKYCEQAYEARILINNLQT